MLAYWGATKRRWQGWVSTPTTSLSPILVGEEFTKLEKALKRHGRTSQQENYRMPCDLMVHCFGFIRPNDTRSVEKLTETCACFMFLVLENDFVYYPDHMYRGTTSAPNDGSPPMSRGDSGGPAGEVTVGGQGLASRVVSHRKKQGKDLRTVMIGDESVGKTTILYKLRLGEIVTTIPTVGFNVETIKYKKKEFTVWDLGGQDQLKPLWRHYAGSTQVVIYVLDATKDVANHDFKDLTEFYESVQEDDRKAQLPACCFYVNKWDLLDPEAAKEYHVKFVAKLCNKDDSMKGPNIPSGAPWYLQSCCASTGEGLYEGLDWLATHS